MYGNKMTTVDMSKSKYLLYTCWEITTSSGCILGGDTLHLVSVQTEEEAKKQIAIIEERSENFYKKFPSSNGKRRYVYILNTPHWWTNQRVQVSKDLLNEQKQWVEDFIGGDDTL